MRQIKIKLAVIDTNRSKSICFRSHGSKTPLIAWSHKREKAIKPNKGNKFKINVELKAQVESRMTIQRGYKTAKQANTAIRYLISFLFTNLLYYLQTIADNITIKT